MGPPFTTAEFWSVFVLYNETVWPAQLALNALGAFAGVWAILKPEKPAVPFVSTAILWAWAAAAYFIPFFTTLSPAGILLAALFFIEAVMILFAIVDVKAFAPPTLVQKGAGAALFVYALFVYPLIGIAGGHHYPGAPTFGLPCPTTIFTLGLFCVFASSISGALFVVPALWAVVGTFGGTMFGAPQDLFLPIAAVVAIALRLIAHMPARHPFAGRRGLS